jgi:Uncharacterized protein involved in outer membrane biogenesis
MTEVTAPQPDAPAPRRRWPMRLFKGLLAALLAAVILVVGGLSILLLTFDPNQYKATLIQVVQEREHRTLTLPGTIELTLFPPLTLRTGPFSLSERDSPAVFARADDLRLHLDLFALLRRKLVVDRVVMIKPQIHVARRAGAFQLRRPAARQQARIRVGAQPAGPVGAPSAGGAGRALLRRRRAKLHGQLDGLDVGLSGLDGGNAGAFHLETTARFVQPALATRIALRGKLQADPAQHSVVLTDLALSAQGDVPGLKAMQTQLSADQLGLRTGSLWALTARQWRIKTTGRTESGETLIAQASLPTLDAKATPCRSGRSMPAPRLARCRRCICSARPSRPRAPGARCAFPWRNAMCSAAWPERRGRCT